MISEDEFSREHILARLQTVVSKISDEPKFKEIVLTEDMPLFEIEGVEQQNLGLDSFNTLIMVVEIEQMYQIELSSSADIDNMRTVADVVSLIQRLAAGHSTAHA